MAFGLLNLRPWELEQMTPLELETMMEGKREVLKNEDMKRALFTAYMVNVHLKKLNQIKVKDIMDQIWPMTMKERKQEEIQFIEEFEAEGGEIYADNVDNG